MSIIVRIGFAIALALFLTRPAFADQYSSIEPRYPTAPNFYPSATASADAAERQRMYPPSQTRDGYVLPSTNSTHVRQSIELSNAANVTINQSVTINGQRYAPGAPAPAPAIAPQPIATPEPEELAEPPAPTVENNMYIQGLYVKRHAQAPADEYFGHANLSILGMGNLIKDINRAAHNRDATAAQDMTHKLVFVEGALRDWQAKYPDDTWLPRFGYATLVDFKTLNGDMPDATNNDAAVHAVDLATWLEALYPNNAYAAAQ